MGSQFNKKGFLTGGAGEKNLPVNKMNLDPDSTEHIKTNELEHRINGEAKQRTWIRKHRRGALVAHSVEYQIFDFGSWS